MCSVSAPLEENQDSWFSSLISINALISTNPNMASLTQEYAQPPHKLSLPLQEMALPSALCDHRLDYKP